MRKVLVLGATSAIAQECCRWMSEQGDQLYLVGRNEGRLKIIADDLKVRGGQVVGIFAADLSQTNGHPAVIAAADQALGKMDTVLIAYGSLPDQKACERDFAQFDLAIQINFLSIASLCERVATLFTGRRGGVLAVISSVAGDRGRQSNYVYGTAKGALSIYLSGLRNRLTSSGVSVVTIKPGFVDTPMTRDFKKGLLWATPKKVGRAIGVAIERRKDVIYVPGFWRVIMFVIRCVPEFLFKKMKL